LVFDYVFYAPLFYLPLPTLLNDFTLESSCHKEKRRDSKSRLFLKGFLKLTLYMFAPNHAMTDARIMIFKLFKGFLNVLYREKLFHI
jgi:hypothetical protein